MLYCTYRETGQFVCIKLKSEYAEAISRHIDEYMSLMPEDEAEFREYLKSLMQ